MIFLCFFLVYGTATTEFYSYWHTLSLHVALPIFRRLPGAILLRGTALPCRRSSASLTLRPSQRCRKFPPCDWAIKSALISSSKISPLRAPSRSEEHTSELQSLMRISYAVFCLKKKITTVHKHKYKDIKNRE